MTVEHRKVVDEIGYILNGRGGGDRWFVEDENQRRR
jgi:hypothetical protein